MLAPVAIITWKIVHERDPGLKPSGASSIITSTPEFQQTGSAVNVSGTSRFNDSMGERYYADFTFTEHGAATPVKGQAEFRYWSDRWHLRSFAYWKGTKREVVPIKSEVSPEEEFSQNR